MINYLFKFKTINKYLNYEIILIHGSSSQFLFSFGLGPPDGFEIII